MTGRLRTVDKVLAMLAGQDVMQSGEIAEALGLKRGTIYEVMADACRKGLVVNTTPRHYWARYRITSMGKERVRQVQTTGRSPKAAKVRVPAAPRQWFEV